jgi:hypothetical protein
MNSTSPAPGGVRETEVVEPEAPRVTHLAITPEFTVTSSSARDLEEATAELRIVGRTFVEIFGEIPPAIDVNVLAASVTDSVQESVRDDVRIMAAGTWLQRFANDWCESVAGDRDALIDPPERNITCNGEIPDWLALGSLQVLTDNTAEAQANAVLAEPGVRLIPMADFLERRVVPTDSVSSEDDVVFIAESISVMRYLRTLEGPTVLGDIARGAVAGLTTREILARLPKTTTPESLDRGWRHWLAAMNANV